MLAKRPDLSSMLAGIALALSVSIATTPLYSIAALFFAWFGLITATATSETKAFIFVLGGLLVAGNAYLYNLLDTNLEKSLTIAVFTIAMLGLVDIISKKSAQ